jgi:hypothetical protein
MADAEGRRENERRRRLAARFRRLAAALALAGALLALGGLAAGCGYSFSGRGRAGDVYIPFFEDRTAGDRAVDIGTELTRRVVAEFQQDRSTRVFQAAAERDQADKELLGIVHRLTESVLSRDPTETGEEYRVVVSCAITYRDLNTDQVLWQDQSVSGDGVYALEAGEAGFQAALEEALVEIVDGIVDKTLRAW